MDLPLNPAMAYKYRAELLVKDYLLDVPYAAVLVGILMCKLVLSFTLSHPLPPLPLLSLMINVLVYLRKNNNIKHVYVFCVED